MGTIKSIWSKHSGKIMIAAVIIGGIYWYNSTRKTSTNQVADAMPPTPEVTPVPSVSTNTMQAYS